MIPNDYILNEMEKSSKQFFLYENGPSRPASFVVLWLLLVSFLFVSLTDEDRGKTQFQAKKAIPGPVHTSRKGPVAYEF